jgi:predicted nucleic acid-binding protein
LAPALVPYVADPTPRLVSRVETVVEPKDAPVVAAALTARVDYLVTYDRKHLLHYSSEILSTFQLVVTTPDRVVAEVREAGHL